MNVTRRYTRPAPHRASRVPLDGGAVGYVWAVPSGRKRNGRRWVCLVCWRDGAESEEGNFETVDEAISWANAEARLYALPS